jgi:adenylate cyclase
MPAMAKDVDYEAEGFLAGLEGEELESRIALLDRLVDARVGIEDLRSAIAESRLAVLPVEMLLAGEPRYSPNDLAERSGVPIEVLERQWRSVGLAIGDRDERRMSAEDLQAAHRQRALLDSGLDPDSIAEMGRTIAVAMSQFAAASRQIMATRFAAEGDTEEDVSERIYEQVRSLMPLVGPTLDYVYRLHLREQLRHTTLAADELRDREGGPAAETITVAFADLVGYTQLGEELPPEELGRVTGRLDELAREVAHGPVRLVKLIGDAAMLASADTGCLLEAAHDLVDAMAEEGEGQGDFPLIRAGVARGAALSRAGDFYGAPVNLASRVTGVARPGSVLVTTEVRDEVSDDYRFSRAGRKHLKGIAGTVDLYRCRRNGGDDSEGDE